MKRKLLPLVVFTGMAGLLAFLFLARSTADSSASDGARIFAGVQSFTAACRAEGRPVPETVTLAELVRGGWVPAGDLGAFAGLEVTFHPKAGMDRPQDRLVDVRLPDGQRLAALADGSVQAVRR